MQDISTGLLHEIESLKQSDKDAAIPQRENQGPTFYLGEVVDVKGGKFKVHAISDKRLYLDSIPSK